MISFIIAQEQPLLIYNLAFGDVDENGDIDDMAITNNEDRDKVLATVADAINQFCKQHGNHLIFAQGSNAVRTRLYQMGIAKNLEEITKEFDVKGLTNKGWEPFNKNVNYDAFLASKK